MNIPRVPKLFDFSEKEPNKIVIGVYDAIYPIPDTPEIKEIKCILHNGMGLYNSGRYKSAIATYVIAADRLNEYISELKASLNESV